MNTLEILSNLGQSKLNEFDIGSQLKEASDVEECKWEHMAFNFMENYQAYDSAWTNYFGPMLSFRKVDRALVEYPSRKEITVGFP